MVEEDRVLEFEHYDRRGTKSHFRIWLSELVEKSNGIARFRKIMKLLQESNPSEEQIQSIRDAIDRAFTSCEKRKEAIIENAKVDKQIKEEFEKRLAAIPTEAYYVDKYLMDLMKEHKVNLKGAQKIMREEKSKCKKEIKCFETVSKERSRDFERAVKQRDYLKELRGVLDGMEWKR